MFGPTSTPKRFPHRHTPQVFADMQPRQNPGDHLSVWANDAAKKLFNKFGAPGAWRMGRGPPSPRSLPSPAPACCCPPRSPRAEDVLFSDLFQKINRRDKAQERAIVVTNRAVYNLKPSNLSSCKRRIPVDLIDAVTISLISDEFVLHIPEEYDYRLLGSRKVGGILPWPSGVSFVSVPPPSCLLPPPPARNWRSPVSSCALLTARAGCVPPQTECIEALQRAHLSVCRARFVVHESTQILLKNVCHTKPMMKDKKHMVRGGDCVSLPPAQPRLMFCRLCVVPPPQVAAEPDPVDESLLAALQSSTVPPIPSVGVGEELRPIAEAEEESWDDESSDCESPV